MPVTVNNHTKHRKENKDERKHTSDNGQHCGVEKQQGGAGINRTVTATMYRRDSRRYPAANR